MVMSLSSVRRGVGVSDEMNAGWLSKGVVRGRVCCNICIFFSILTISLFLQLLVVSRGPIV